MAAENKKIELDTDLGLMDDVVSFIEGFVEACALGEDLLERMVIAITEAVTNGMEHGNDMDPEKKVTLEIIKKPDCIEATVDDEGDGFVRSEAADPTLPENLLKDGGRGLLFIDTYANEVFYENAGRRCRMIFKDAA